MRRIKGELSIIDFAVANWQPRIVELAVLLSDLFLNQANPTRALDWITNEYQKYHKLTLEELEYLPLFIRVSHAMNVLGASYERAQGNTLGENNEWLKLGRIGLGL